MIGYSRSTPANVSSIVQMWKAYLKDAKLCAHMIWQMVVQFKFTPYLLLLCYALYALGFLLKGGSQKGTAAISTWLFIFVAMFNVALSLNTYITSKQTKLFPRYKRLFFISHMLMSLIVALHVILLSHNHSSPWLTSGAITAVAYAVFVLVSIICIRYADIWWGILAAMVFNSVANDYFNEIHHFSSSINLLLFAVTLGILWLAIYFAAFSARAPMSSRSARNTAIPLQALIDKMSTFKYFHAKEAENEADHYFAFLSTLYKRSTLGKIYWVAKWYIFFFVCAALSALINQGEYINQILFATCLIAIAPAMFVSHSLVILSRLRLLWTVSIGSREKLWSTYLSCVKKLFTYCVLVLAINLAIVKYFCDWSFSSSVLLLFGVSLSAIWLAYVIGCISTFKSQMNPLTRLLTVLLLLIAITIELIALANGKWALSFFIGIAPALVCILLCHRALKTYVLYGDLERQSPAVNYNNR